MATNKNQHYVPQCYLRQFSVEGSRSAINLLNIDRKKFIECASIKSQCSKSYFYGEDLRLEKALQPIEGEYSSVIKLISKQGYRLTDYHRNFLRRFWLLQNMRTEAASIRSIQMTDEMGEVVGADARQYRLELKEAVQQSMEMFIEKINIIDDLKICLIKNKSEVDFITSDDPAVLTNRWHIQNKHSKGISFGLGSAGNITLLPLTPRILCLGYDGDVYSISHKKGWVDVRNKKDIQSFNEHQFLNCRANIFARDVNSQDSLLASLADIESNRPESRHKIHYAILDRNENGFKRYKVIDRNEADDHKEAIMHCQMISAQPNSWSKQIHWRNKGVVYTNGSGVGY